MGDKKKKKDKREKSSKGSKPSSRKKSSSKNTRESADPRGRALIKLCEKEKAGLRLSENIFSEIKACEKGVVDKNCERLSMRQVSYGDSEYDIDKESRVFQLSQLKHRADELLQAELAKGNVYTHQQYLEKTENLAYNYKKLLGLNKEGDMEKFQYHLGLLNSPSDLYFEKYELIEELQL